MASDDIQIRLRMLGAALFSREASAAAADLGKLGPAGRRAAAGMQAAEAPSARLRKSLERVGGVVNSAGGGLGAGLLLAGRGAQMGAIGVGILGVAVGRLGGHYNAMQDSQRVAFTTLLGSAAKAEAFMRRLQGLALKSPVLDPESTGNAARMLLAYGVSLKDVLPLVQAIGDMSAASGKSVGEVMPQAAMAIGQIASKGKLQAEELNQLAESVGLSRGRIRKALKMTRDEFETAFTPGNSISATKALPAILKAMEGQSAGAADRLAKTTAGRIDRAKETMKVAAGSFTRPFYDELGKLAGGVADKLAALNQSGAVKGFSRNLFRTIAGGLTAGAGGAKLGGKGLLAGITGKLAPGGHMANVGRDIGAGLRKGFDVAKGAVSQFLDAIKPMQPFFANILLPLLKGIAIGVIGGVVAAFKVAIPIIRITATVLGQLGTWARPLRGVFQGIGMVIGFLFGGPILKAVGALGKLGGVMRYVGVVARVLAWPVRLVTGYVKLQFAAVKLLASGFLRAFTFVSRFVGSFTGFAGKVARPVVNAMGRVIHIIETVPKRALEAGGKIGKAIVNGIVNIIKAAPGAIGSAIGSIIPGPVKGAVKKVLGAIPGLADGGVVRRGGWAMVGERGPELLRLPTGGTVFDHQQTARMPSYLSARAPASARSLSGAAPAGARGGRPIYLVLKEGGRVLAEALAADEALAESLA